MTEDMIRWIAEWAVRLDCLVFVQHGHYGSQPVLLPRRLYASATLHAQ